MLTSTYSIHTHIRIYMRIRKLTYSQSVRCMYTVYSLRIIHPDTYRHTHMRTQRRVWHMAGGNVQSLTSCVIMMYQGTAHPGTAHPGIELFIDPSSSRFYY